MTLQDQLELAKKIMEAKIFDAVKEYEELTGLRMVEVDVIRGDSFGKITNKFLSIQCKTEI